MPGAEFFIRGIAAQGREGVLITLINIKIEESMQDLFRPVRPDHPGGHPLIKKWVTIGCRVLYQATRPTLDCACS
jgi:hypothetical protein